MFHEEMLPTYLLYAISASRQNVPFPSVVELLLMDISFEMIREAGVRMPGPIGSILGIVGGLILGQAAVSAKIVSPIMIIIIAITGIGSFATADYSLGWSYRILKIIFVLLAAVFGFYGIALGFFVYAILLASSKSFGIPFLSPLPGNEFYKRAVFVAPISELEKRPVFLAAKKKQKEDKISKKWKIGR
jgi:spore germination protein KA